MDEWCWEPLAWLTLETLIAGAMVTIPRERDLLSSSEARLGSTGAFQVGLLFPPCWRGM